MVPRLPLPSVPSCAIPHLKLKERKWRLEAPGQEAEAKNQSSRFSPCCCSGSLQELGQAGRQHLYFTLSKGDWLVAICPPGWSGLGPCCTGIRDQNNPLADLSFLDLLL